MSEISSGLVAVAWIAPDEDRFRVRICEDRPTDAPLWSPMCWVSDAEAIIAQKDAEILDQCRINGMGAERELHLLAQVAAKDAEIERLKHKSTIEDADTTVDHLRAYAADNGYSHGDYADVMSEAASQIEQQSERIKELESDVDEEAHIRDRMAKLLAETAVALKGPEKALHRHGWQDLPDVAAKQSAALKLAREALGKLSLYVAYNGDDWVKRNSTEALAAINEVINVT